MKRGEDREERRDKGQEDEMKRGRGSKEDGNETGQVVGEGRKRCDPEPNRDFSQNFCQGLWGTPCLTT